MHLIFYSLFPAIGFICAFLAVGVFFDSYAGDGIGIFCLGLVIFGVAIAIAPPYIYYQHTHVQPNTKNFVRAIDKGHPTVYVMSGTVTTSRYGRKYPYDGGRVQVENVWHDHISPKIQYHQFDTADIRHQVEHDFTADEVTSIKAGGKACKKINVKHKNYNYCAEHGPANFLTLTYTAA